MENIINFKEARVYVGTYGKYNNGSLYGKWLNLADYSDSEEFYGDCRSLHHDEHDPEYMFQDYENIPSGLIGESWISDKVFEIIEAVGNLLDTLHEPFFIWCSNAHHDFGKEEIYDMISSFESEYISYYDSEEDFARELIEERDDLSEFALRYFDYAAYARDLFLSDYWFADGYVFNNI